MARKPTYEELEQRDKGLEKASLKFKRVEEKPRNNDDKQWTSNELFYKAFSMSPIPTSITAISDGNILKVNEAFEQLTGYREYDIKGQPIDDLNVWGKPEDRTGIINDLLEKGPIRNREITVRTRSGEIRVCYFSAEIIELRDKQYILSMAIDETERILAEEALRESEARYREIASSIPGVVYQFLLKKDGSYSSPYMSESASSILDISAEEIMEDAYSLFNMIFEEDLDPVNQSIAESAQTMERWLQEFRIRDKAGNIRWIRATSTPHQLPDGEILWNGVLLDISDHVRTEEKLQKAHNDLEIRIEERTAELAKTNEDLLAEIIEHKKADAALRESEEKYRNIFDSAGEGIIVIQDDIVNFLNRRMLEIIGYSSKDIARLANESFLDFIHPEDQKLVADRYDRRLKGEELPSTYPVRLIKNDGESLWVDLSPTFIFWEGKPATLVFVTDITDIKQAEEALRESEEKYRIVVEDSNDGIFIAQDGVIKFPNPITTQILGHPPEELAKIPFTEFIHPEDREMVVERHIKRLKGENPPSIYSFRVINRVGELLWVQLSTAFITWEGRPATINLVRDITRRKQTEEALNRTNEKMLKEHNQRKVLSKMLIDLLEKDRHQIAIELHDHIGQTLTSLKLNLEVIHNKLESTGSELESQMQAAEEKTIRAIKDVRNISHGLKPSMLDSIGLVSCLRELFDEINTEKDLKINFFSRTVPKRFDQDRELAIYRITQEALTNIIKHAQAKNVFINLIKKDGILSLSVEDDGVGFDKTETMKISKSKGHIGLIIMQERAEQLDGELTMDSQLGKGTHLLVEMPL